MLLNISFAGEKTGSVMLQSIVPVLPENLAKGLNKFGLAIERDAKRGMSKGRNKDVGFFEKSTDSVLHSRTGFLRNSITTEKATAGELTMKVGTNLKYGGYNEFGAIIPVTQRMRYFLMGKGIFLKKTTITLNLPARPWLHPAFDKNKESGMELIKRETLKPIGQ